MANRITFSSDPGIPNFLYFLLPLGPLRLISVHSKTAFPLLGWGGLVEEMDVFRNEYKL
jgi:hypothetical protein